MKLKEKINYIEFLQAVDACEGEVRFVTDFGDVLNLKSTLTRYVFAAVTGNKALLNAGRVQCDHPGDTQKLREFLMEEPLS